jgi:RecA/RadA recombinase
VRFFQNVDLNLEKYQKIKENGLLNPQFLGLLTKAELITIFGISSTEKNIENLNEVMKKLKKAISIQEEKVVKKAKWTLSTGSQNLNQLFDQQGLLSGEITLLYGAFRTGKSQLAHQCVFEVYTKFKDDLPQKFALFIDTENTFRPERIRQMASAHHIDPNEILNHIDIISTSTLSEFSLVFPKIEALIEENQIKFIVIDSLTKIFRLEIAKNEKKISAIIAELSKILMKLNIWARRYNIPILVTSQVSASMNSTHFFKVVPILATTLNTYIKLWILLGEDEQLSALAENTGVRYAHLINSQTSKEQIAKFRITTDGIQDWF